MTQRPQLIIETDVFSDVDDLGALAVACSLAALGHARILSIGVNTPSRHGPVAVSALLRELECTVPVGDLGYNDDSVYEHDFARFVADTFAGGSADGANDTSVTEPAWLVHRRSLAAADSKSVTVVSLGFLDNLVALIDSPPDELSELSGLDLVRDRARRLVVMGGTFPAGTEFNLARSPRLTNRLLGDWPTPIEFLGYEVGADVITGRVISRESQSIVGSAYRRFTGPGAGRESWDPLAILLAAPPEKPLFRMSPPGYVRISPTGENTFHVAEGGPHRYAIAAVSNDILARAVDTHLK